MVNIYKSFSFKSLGLLGVAAFMLCFANIANAQLSGNLTINKSLPSSSTNFTTFKALFTALSSQGVNGPVTVDVSNGPYTEQISANAISGVSSTNTVTINGNGQVLQYTATSSSNRHTIRFNGTDWVTLKNLTIKGLGTTYAWGVRFYNNANNNTLDGCTIEIPNMSSSSSSNSVCVVATASPTSAFSSGNNCGNLTVKNCTLTGGTTSRGPYAGMILYSKSSESTFTGHKIYNNVIKNFYYYGIRLYRSNDVEAFDNDIYRDPTYTRYTTTYPFYINQCRNTKIRRNRIHSLFPNNTGYLFRGIYHTGSTSSSGSHDVTNNLIYDIRNTSTFYGIYVSCTRNVDMRYNTISKQSSSGTQYGIYVQCSYGGRSITNNIIALHGSGSPSRIGIYHWSNTMDIDYNNIYVTGSNSNIARLQGTYYQTPAAWQAATGYGAPFDANSSFVDPNFISTTDGDKLIPRAVAIDDIGTPIAGITVDNNGVTRSSTNPDPGGLEFTVDANVNSLTSQGGTMACQGENDVVEVWIKNNAPFAIEGFSVTYEATGDNAKSVTEQFVGSIPSGDSAKYTFKEELNFVDDGSTDVIAYIGKKPGFGPHSITINPSPVGVDFKKGSTFNGQFLTGNNTDPDIVANPDEIILEVLPPSGYNNSDFNSTWNISTYNVTSVKNATINASDVVRTDPVGSSNLKLSVKPSAALTDDTLLIDIAAYSLTTMCEAPVLQRYIFVAPRPVADFNFADVCDGEAMQFVNASTISTGTIDYDWAFGDGGVSDFADVNKTYNNHGQYTVELTVTSNYGYTDVVTKTVEVYQAPEIDFSYENKCFGDAVPFTDMTNSPNGALVYSWDFGDGSGTSTQKDPTYTYSAADVYYTKLTVTDPKNCIATITRPITYSANPTADFTVPTLVCNQNDVKFTNTSTPVGNTGYFWDFGNTLSAQTEDGTTTFPSAGTYTVSLTALTDFGCSDSKVTTVTITESPIADFTIDGQCIGDPVSFVNTSTEPAGTTGYEWYFGEDGAVSSSKDDSYTYNSVGKYTVTLKASADNGCSTEKSTEVTFGEKPVVDFSAPSNACVGEDVTLLNSSVVSSGTLNHTWDFGNGSNSSTANPTANYSAAGNYTIELISESGIGCSSTVSKTIEVSDIPNSDFTFNTAQTGDGRMTFTPVAPNGSANYKWLYGDGGTSTEKGVHNYVYSGLVGLFKVTLIVDNNGCTSTTTKEMVINALGVNDINGGKLQVYPNPTAGDLTVDLENVNGVSKIQIVDMLGKVVATQEANAATQTYTFNLAAKSAGIYFVQVHTVNGVYSKKITLSK